MSAVEGLVQIDKPLDGDRNMAIDESLLKESSSDSPIVVRVYRWSEPTLSLGHFQQTKDIVPDASWSKLPIVQRKTGGGAIVHDQELTYSIVIPQRAEIGLKGHCEPVYRAVHEQFVQAIRELGCDAKLAEECNCRLQPEGKPRFLCFERRSPVDVVVGQSKLIGSAQRRTKNGLLQHGSVLLRASSAAPNLLGLLDLLSIGDKSTMVLAAQRNVASHIDPSDWAHWTAWLVDNLTIGLNKVVQCYWRPRPIDYNSMGVSPTQD